MQVILKVIEGPDAGREFVFEGFQQFVLGRDGQRDTRTRVPRDPYMSRNHCLLVFAGSHCFAQDLDSANGVFVNGKRIKEADLHHGDLLQAGRSVMRVEMRGGTSRKSEPNRKARRPKRAKISHYVLEERIDLDGQAEIYRARDSRKPRTVALKVVGLNPEDSDAAISHFLRETTIHRRLRHAHIVRTLESGREGQVLWLAMEFVEGETLEQRVEREGPQPVATVTTLGRHLLDALDCAHSQGFIHRDIKPANIMLEPLPGGFLTKLLDFGFAKSFRDPGAPCLTSSGKGKGTPQYTAREQVLNAKNVQPVADLFSVGACLYFALTNRWHYEIGKENAWAAILEGKNIPIRKRRPDIPAGLAKVIDRALAREPANRFPGATAMLKALQKAS